MDNLKVFRNNFQISGYLMFDNTPVAKIINDSVIVIDKDLIPLYYLNHNPNVDGWLNGRCFDSSRTNVRLLKRILNIRKCPSKEIAIKFHAISITDRYWIKLDNENCNYRDVSSLDDRLHKASLNGEFIEEDVLNTPEVTNVGSFEKCWKKENGVWNLKKLAKDKELFSEIFTFRLGKLFGFNMAEYYYDSSLDCISSPNFVGKCDKVFLTEIRELMDNDDDVYDSAELISKLPNGKDLIKQYLDIVFLDSFIYNFDRHTGNYGFLRDTNTGKIVSMAPNYDNNNSLISREYRDRTPKIIIDEFKELSNDYNYKVPNVSLQQIEDVADEVFNDLLKYRPSIKDLKLDKVKLFLGNNYKELITIG